MKKGGGEERRTKRKERMEGRKKDGRKWKERRLKREREKCKGPKPG